MIDRCPSLFNNMLINTSYFKTMMRRETLSFPEPLSLSVFDALPVLCCSRLASQLQVLQHVGFPGRRRPLLRGHVCHQLVGRPLHQRHRPGSLHLRQLQEARWATLSLAALHTIVPNNVEEITATCTKCWCVTFIGWGLMAVWATSECQQ